ncbi:MAG: type II toxin-antitoxin system ParD family antitoxin [Gammaproteobacteria bacterium]|nr:type II toxin-antitoxin system ParD family antitoxin [Gammaproteobacteria bacterium]
MSKNISILLGKHLSDFVNNQIESGHYSSASEVLQTGLRLLEERETKVEALRNALVEGEHSGVSTSFDFDAFIANKTSS